MLAVKSERRWQLVRFVCSSCLLGGSGPAGAASCRPRADLQQGGENQGQTRATIPNDKEEERREEEDKRHFTSKPPRELGRVRPYGHYITNIYILLLLWRTRRRMQAHN
jgi:hypothetical protein